MLDLTNKTIAELIDPRGFECECGNRHAVSIRYIKTGRNILNCVPEMVEAGAKAIAHTMDELHKLLNI